jgi:hypothetical protein
VNSLIVPAVVVEEVVLVVTCASATEVTSKAIEAVRIAPKWRAEW